jgi:hypothetical protein
MSVTPQAVQAAQGTRLSSKAPWETYSEELAVETTPELEAQIAEYAEHRYEGVSSNQTKEELARWKELAWDASDEYRWLSPEEYTDVEARIGRILHSSEVISLLRTRLHLKCWLRAHPQLDKLTLVVQKRGQERLPPSVGCWMKNGFMPEFSVMGFDDHGVPLAEKYRGWRTCLLQLILKGIISEDEAHKVFGATDRSCSNRYNQTLWAWRNRGPEFETE